MFVFVLLWISLCPFYFCNLLEEEERAGCFAFTVLHMSFYCKCSVTLPHGVWVGLRCMIVVFTDNTPLYFALNITLKFKLIF